MSTQPSRRLALMLACAGVLTCVHAETWTYRGHLQDADRAANGEYALKLQLFDAPSGGRPIGSAVVVPGVAVKNGSFAADVDFGATLANAPTLWLEVEVAAPKESFNALGTRQKFDPKAALAGVCWDTQGNAALAGDFLGTTNTQPLELKVNSLRVARYEPGSISPNVISGSPVNAVTAGVRGATIAGGGMPSGTDPDFASDAPNLVTDAYGTVGGGYANRAGDNSGTTIDHAFATVAGGALNTAGGLGSSVLGGFINTASGDNSSVSGGSGNTASGSSSGVGAGSNNMAIGNYSGVGAGNSNMASGDYSSVGAGSSNTASANYSSVSGGAQNTASGISSTVGGGVGNCAGGTVSWAGGVSAKVRPGSGSGTAGTGCSGVTPAATSGGDQGTFVWADSQSGNFVSTGSNQFLIRATGGVALNGPPISDSVELTIVADNDGADFANVFLRQRATNAGVLISAGSASGANDSEIYFDQFNGSTQTRRLTLGANGDLTVTANAIKPGGGSWAAPSDARLKRNIDVIQSPLARLLALHGVEFEYLPGKYADAAPGRQVGFVAQEVEQVMPGWVGRSADGYRFVAVKGFEALTVEALRELKAAQDGIAANTDGQGAALASALAELHAESAALRRDNAALQSELDSVRRQLAAHAGARAGE